MKKAREIFSIGDRVLVMDDVIYGGGIEGTVVGFDDCEYNVLVDIGQPKAVMFNTLEVRKV